MNYELISASGEILASNLCSLCRNCKQNFSSDEIVKRKCAKDNQYRKSFKQIGNNGEIYCCSNDEADINSNKIFKDRIRILKDILITVNKISDSVKETVNQNTKRLLHNVTTLNAHNIQELYALVPQETLTQNLAIQFKIIEQEILNDPTEAAKTFLRIAKNNAALKTEFSVFKKLFEIEPNLQFKKHYLHKILLNLLHIFFHYCPTKVIEFRV